MLVVVIGAGASYDCVSGDRQPRPQGDYRPPLVRDLFDPTKTRFSDIMTAYPLVQHASPEIWRATNNTSLALEAYLRERLRDSSNERDKLTYAQIPLYLQELLHAVTTNYTRHPDNYGSLVNKITRLEAPIIVSLNYDTILDELLSVYRPLTYLDGYLSEDDWSLIKLHGSINWGQQILGTNMRFEDAEVSRKFSTMIQSLGPTPKLADEIVVMPGPSLSKLRFEGQDTVFYPHLSVPVGQDDDIRCPTSHTNFFRQRLATAEQVDLLMIGYSGNDREVLSLLEGAKGKIRKIQVVSGEAQSGHILLRKLSTMYGLNVMISPEDFVSTGGFSAWISEGRMDQFFSDM